MFIPLVGAIAAECTGFASPTIVTTQCTPSGTVNVTFGMFHSISYFGDGAAVFVSSSVIAMLQSSSFFNCTAGVEGGSRYFGGCAYLMHVLSGSGALDCCETKCGAQGGSFWWFYFYASVDAVVKGLAAFDSKSAFGVLEDIYARVRVSGCNFTKQNGTWGTSAYAAAIYQLMSGSSTKANFTLFESCVGGLATFYLGSGNAATFAGCVFVDCSPAIAHESAVPGHHLGATGRDTLERSFFGNTTLKSSTFQAGSVLICDCLFAGPLEVMPANFTATGAQLAYAGTRINLANPSQLETCPVQGEAAFDPMASPAESPVPSKTRSAMPSETPEATPSDGFQPTPTAVAATPTSTTNDNDGKPGVSKWVWIVVGVAIAVIVTGLSLGLFLWRRRRRDAAVGPDGIREVAEVTQQEPSQPKPGFGGLDPEILGVGGQVAPPETSGDTLPLDDIVESDDDTTEPAGRKRRAAKSNGDEDSKLSSGTE